MNHSARSPKFILRLISGYFYIKGYNLLMKKEYIKMVLEYSISVFYTYIHYNIFFLNMQITNSDTNNEYSLTNVFYGTR